MTEDVAISAEPKIYRSVKFFSSDVELCPVNGSAFIMRSREALLPYDGRLGDWLERWARETPERTFLVEQTADGERSLSFATARKRALDLAEGLLKYSLGPEQPLIIMAPAGIDHGLFVLAAHHLGVPIAPLAPAYALQSHDFVKLKRVVDILTPGLVVVADGAAYAAALDATVPVGVPIVALANPIANRHLDFNALHGDGTRSEDVMHAAARVSHSTIAKFLFTSGSTGLPKAVINTHGMLCAAAQMQRQVMPFLADEPPIMVDWLPWNHTAGGNSIFNIVLHNGGTLYIDPGKPTNEQIGPTLELLRRVSPSVYFNVPLGYDVLIPYLEADEALRASFFCRLRCVWYAAAAMRADTWNSIERLAFQTIGERLLIVTGLGMTETSPAALFGNLRATGPGIVGVPIPGVELKLVQQDDKFEARFRGPNVTPGYWRDEAATLAAFDSDGFFRSGDLLSFVDPNLPEAGLRFEGRASDEFKLGSGTRVAAGALRAQALEVLAPLITDAVIVGADREDVRILLFPDWTYCAATFDLHRETLAMDVTRLQTFRRALEDRLSQLSRFASGSANRIVAGMIVIVPPSAAAGELTEKGTINGRFFQRNRPELLDILFGGESPLIIRPQALSKL